MRFRSALLAAATLCLFTAASPAGKGTPAEFLGTWKGTSICVRMPGNEACNDEVVIYEVTPSKEHPGGVTVSADKIVNGERGLMGVMEFQWNAKAGEWQSEFTSRRGHGIWRFKIDGKKLTGTLQDADSHDGKVWRNVDVTKEK